MNPTDEDRHAVAIWSDPDRCFPFSKGRVALYAILRALGLGPGDEVLVPGFTCVVVPAAICYTGATPVFYDIDPVTLQGNPVAARHAMTQRTRAVIVQHNYGNLASFGDLRVACAATKAALIEDCAHAMGARRGGDPVGTFGDAAFVSLQWSKPTTIGLGGIARANDEGLAPAIRELAEASFTDPSVLRAAYLGILSSVYRSWYRPSWYWTAQTVYRWAGARGLIQGSSSPAELISAEIPAGYCERLGSLRRASLDAALAKLPAELVRRREIYAWYRERLASIDTWHPSAADADEVSAALRYPVLVENRDDLLRRARTERVEIGDWFNAPLHPAGCRPAVFRYVAGTCPLGEAAAARVINLPTHRHVTLAAAARIVDFVQAQARFTNRIDWQQAARD